MGGMRSAYVQYIKHGLTQPIRLSFPGNVLSWSPIGWGFWFPLTTLHQSKPWGMDIHNDCFLSSSRTSWVHGLSFSPINLIERDHLPGTIIFCRSCPFHSESIITMYGSFLWRFFSHFIELFLVHSFDPINFSYVRTVNFRECEQTRSEWIWIRRDIFDRKKCIPAAFWEDCPILWCNSTYLTCEMKGSEACIQP